MAIDDKKFEMYLEGQDDLLTLSKRNPSIRIILERMIELREDPVAYPLYLKRKAELEEQRREWERQQLVGQSAGPQELASGSTV